MKLLKQYRWMNSNIRRQNLYFDFGVHLEESQWINCTILKNVFFLGPPNITAKPTDPLAAPSFNFTVEHTQAPTGPPTTVASTVIPETTTATTITTSTTGEEDVQVAGPDATGRVLPIPPTPTDAPQAPPSTDPPPPPTLVGVDNETTFAPDTPTPETYIDEDIVTVETAEPEMEFPSDSPPHGECAYSGNSLFKVRINRLYPPWNTKPTN